MKKLNIIWIIVDAIRSIQKPENYPNDDLYSTTKLKTFDKGLIECQNMFTSAPSSLMAVSSMITSLPGVYLNRTYDSFEIDLRYFLTLPMILKSKGYENCSVFCYREGRTCFANFFNPVLDKESDSIYKERYQTEWSNKKVTEIIKYKIENFCKNNKNFFIFAHYKRGTKRFLPFLLELLEFKKKKNLEDNTIFILGSDHGYPLLKDKLQAKRLSIKGHDQIMTNANLQTLFIMKIPDVKYAKKITVPLQTIDIMPTLLEILDINDKPEFYNYLGKSFLNLILGEKLTEEPIIRSDTRYIYQPYRKTAIIKNNYKLVWSFEKKKIDIFNLKSDPYEENPLKLNINNQKHKTLYDSFNQSEQQFLRFQHLYFVHKIEKLKKLRILSSNSTILLFPMKNELFETEIRKVLRECFKSFDTFDKIKSSKYDIGLVIFNDKFYQLYPYLKTQIKNIKRQIKKLIFLNYNFEIITPRKKLYEISYILERLWRERSLIIKHPKIILSLRLNQYILMKNEIKNFR